MPIKPTVDEAKRRLRLDDALSGDLASAIEQAYAEALAFLDRDALYDNATDLAAAATLAQNALDDETDDALEPLLAAHLARVKTGMVATPDLISAQLLLIDVLVGSNTVQDRESKQKAAENILWRHRRVTC